MLPRVLPKKDEDKYKFYFLLHVVFVAIYFVYNVIEILVEGKLENTILGIVFLTLLVTRFGKPYGRFFMGMGIVAMFMDLSIYLEGSFDAKMGLTGAFFENTWLVVMGCSGYLINTYHPKKCSDCGKILYNRPKDCGWEEYGVRKGVKKKNLLVCDVCLGNEFWTKLNEMEEDKEHHLPFERLTKLRKTDWFFPVVELVGAGVFAAFGLMDMAWMFVGFAVFSFVMSRYYKKKKSNFKEGDEDGKNVSVVQ